MRHIQSLILIAVVMAIAACATQPSGPQQGSYKVGQPYEVGGEWYYPKENYSYDETGVASWYGEAFHGGTTANGEIFNKNELTAAHKTLPLPSLARVTNLDNGRSIVVRINDRGPFSNARLIDLSQRAAQLLGFENQGTAKVRVQVLADESKAIADAMRHYGGSQPTQMASDSAAPVSSEDLEPVKTTPTIHEQLVETKPVQEVVQVPVAASNKLFIQAGAFTKLENATRMQESLEKLGKVTVSNSVVNGVKFYRVRVGPLDDVPHADALLAKVKGSGVTSPRIVVDQAS